jgi:hypothetical protein
MDFRTIRVDEVTFEPIRNGRHGVRYGANTSVRFQIPRAMYRISSKIPGVLTLTPSNINYPEEFVMFISKILDKSGVSSTQPLERFVTNDNTLIFDHDNVVSNDTPPGSIIDASLLVSIKGTWSNGVTSGLLIDIEQIKVHALTKPISSPKVYINGVSV